MTWLLAACGGGGGGDDGGGFVGAEPIRVDISTETDTLPLNTLGAGPSRGGPFTTAIDVTARLPNGAPMANATSVQFAITGGQESGILYYLDSENVDAEGNPLAFSSASQGMSSGTATLFLHATGVPGPVEVTASVADPNNNGRLVSERIVIQVGGGTGTGTPTELFFIAPTTMVIGLDAVPVQVFVLDESGRPVPNPAPGVNNVRVELLDSSIGAGESLVGVNAQGNRMVGQVVFLRTTNGVATLTLNSADFAGSLVLQATADQADNNVDDGVEDPLREADRVDVVTAIPDPNNPLTAPQEQTLRPAVTDVFYVDRLEVEGGVPPYAWTIRAGSLPPGLNLDNDGLISGRPTQAGTYNFVALVTDTAGGSVQVEVSLEVLQGEAPSVASGQLSDGTVGQSYQDVLIAEGGTPPYRWSIPQGSLPRGLTLDPIRGTITGTPLSAGNFNFVAQVIDANGQTGQQTLNIAVGSPEEIVIATADLADGNVGQSYAQVLRATGGLPPYTWRVIQGALPPGLALSSTQGTIAGTPTQDGTFSFVVQATGTGGNTAVEALSITIGEPGGGDGPPEVLFTIPANGAQNVSIDSDITIRFNQEMDPITVTNATITVTNTETDEVFAMGPVTADGGDTFTLTNPENRDLAPEAPYTVTVTTAVRNLEGTPLVQPFAFSFTTGEATGDQVDNLQLLLSSPQLQSAGPDPVTLTAVVKDANNNVLPNQTVDFSVVTNAEQLNACEDVNEDITLSPTEGATIQVTRSITNEAGTAEARLTSPGDKSNRRIVVRANAGGVDDCAVVAVVGTDITITGPTSGVQNTDIPLVVSLEDSAGNSIPNQEITVVSENGNNINGTTPPVTVVTGVNGQVEIIVDAVSGDPVPESNNITDTIIATGLGASGSQILEISTDDFRFTTPPETLALGETVPLTIIWESGGIGVDNTLVTFSTTRGSIQGGDFSDNADFTDINGNATVTLRAGIPGQESTAGPAVITATTDSGPSARITVLFVATDPAKIDLQATPAVLGTNPPGTDGEQSRITAVVRDEDNNPVRGIAVNFTLVADVTGGTISPSSGVTDAFGRVTATYVAGSIPSADNGVVIQASIPDQDPNQAGVQPVPATVRLTVARRELFISLGTGNEVVETSPTRYALPYNVLVTDAAGGPVANTSVTLSVVPVSYDKGFYFFPAGGSRWQQVVTTNPSCENEDNRETEDVDGDGILDLNEDLDGDGNFDIQNEDLDGDGELDIGEDLDGDGNLDVNEDIDGDDNFDNVNEDIDGDGRLDVNEDVDNDGRLDVDEDIDNDGRLDVDEDVDNDGRLDVNEDLNNNNLLDPGEDIDNDGRLDVDEDIDNDGRLDVDEDIDNDGRLDVDEDIDNDGRLDVDEDIDNDGNFDLGEDRNRNGILDLAGVANGILDPGEDLNDNGRLDPGNVATVSESTVVTGSDGFAEFQVLYAQENANWVTVDLIARASVSGTESIEVATFRLEGVSDDFTDENVDPPGNPSPFGQSNSCLDAN